MIKIKYYKLIKFNLNYNNKYKIYNQFNQIKIEFYYKEDFIKIIMNKYNSIRKDIYIILMIKNYKN